MINLPTVEQILQEYAHLTAETADPNNTECLKAYAELGVNILKNRELLSVILLSESGSLCTTAGLFLDGILIGMAIAEKRKLEEMAKI